MQIDKELTVLTSFPDGIMGNNNTPLTAEDILSDTGNVTILDSMSLAKPKPEPIAINLEDNWHIVEWLAERGLLINMPQTRGDLHELFKYYYYSTQMARTRMSAAIYQGLYSRPGRKGGMILDDLQSLPTIIINPRTGKAHPRFILRGDFEAANDLHNTPRRR